jgi:hypothetical protein
MLKSFNCERCDKGVHPWGEEDFFRTSTKTTTRLSKKKRVLAQVCNSCYDEVNEYRSRNDRRGDVGEQLAQLEMISQEYMPDESDDGIDWSQCP